MRAWTVCWNLGTRPLRLLDRKGLRLELGAAGARGAAVRGAVPLGACRAVEQRQRWDGLRRSVVLCTERGEHELYVRWLGMMLADPTYATCPGSSPCSAASGARS